MVDATQQPLTQEGTFTPGAGGADPNTITDPTGGAPNFSVLDAFESFGYYPTQAEIDSLAPSFEGRIDPGSIGRSAVAQYVNVKQKQAEFAKNDPLTALQTRMNDAVKLQTDQVQGLYSQLTDTLSSAPKLFGSLTPDQIDTYLAPLKNSFDTQLASVQGAMASRGVAGSSTENNALAQTGTQFKENVLSTGLSIGQQQQQQKAAAIQAQINNLFGLTGTELGISGSAASQQSSQMLGQSNLISSLPSFLDAQAAQQEAIAKANQGGGFWDTFNKVTGGINTAVNTVGNLATFGKNISTPFGGISNASPTNSAPQGNNPFTSSSTPGYSPASAGQPLDLFAATGSAFGS